MKNKISPATIRTRRFLMMLPLLVLPFLTMAFSALGGGSKKSKDDPKSVAGQGLNMRLPEAHFSSDEKMDKFSIYEAQGNGSTSAFDRRQELSFRNHLEGKEDSQTERINRRLAQIQAEMDKPVEAPHRSSVISRTGSSQAPGLQADVERLERMMKDLKRTDREDPEIRRLDAMLEKILEIQDPDRGREKARSGKAGRTEVRVAGSRAEGEPTQAVQAVIHQDQTIVSGSAVKLRLMDSIRIGEALIPHNQFIYGLASVEGERLKIDVETIRHGNSILEVGLSVFDLDGMEGLYTPGALTGDAMNGGADNALRDLQAMSAGRSIPTRIAGAGLEAARGLFRKKSRQVRVKIKAGYRLFLRGPNQLN